jgi:hypothetical protein
MEQFNKELYYYLDIKQVKENGVKIMRSDNETN